MQEGKTKYTTILHEVRKKFRLSVEEYCLADSIHKLSNSSDFPWCKMLKEDIGKFLGISRRTVFRKCAKLALKGLVEQTQEGLRSTPLWRDNAEFVSAKLTQKSDKVAHNSNTNNSSSLLRNKEGIGIDFNLKEELNKLKNSKQRHIQLIGEFLEEKKISIDNHAELRQAIQRHLRAAKNLADFSDKKIGEATLTAEKEYPKYTLETLVKILTR